MDALKRLAAGWFATVTCLEAAGDLQVRAWIGNDALEQVWEDEDLSSGDIGYTWALRLRANAGEQTATAAEQGSYEEAEVDLIDAQIGLELLVPKPQQTPRLTVEFRCRLQGSAGEPSTVQVAGSKEQVKTGAKKRQRISLSPVADLVGSPFDA